VVENAVIVNSTASSVTFNFEEATGLKNYYDVSIANLNQSDVVLDTKIVFSGETEVPVTFSNLTAGNMYSLAFTTHTEQASAVSKPFLVSTTPFSVSIRTEKVEETTMALVWNNTLEANTTYVVELKNQDIPDEPAITIPVKSSSRAKVVKRDVSGLSPGSLYEITVTVADALLSYADNTRTDRTQVAAVEAASLRMIDDVIEFDFVPAPGYKEYYEVDLAEIDQPGQIIEQVIVEAGQEEVTKVLRNVTTEKQYVMTFTTVTEGFKKLSQPFLVVTLPESTTAVVTTGVFTTIADVTTDITTADITTSAAQTTDFTTEMTTTAARTTDVSTAAISNSATLTTAGTTTGISETTGLGRVKMVTTTAASIFNIYFVS
jgi:hypothetical protein